MTAAAPFPRRSTPPTAPTGVSADAPAFVAGTVPYLCVCGSRAVVRPAVGTDAGGGDCPACGRHYAASVLEEAGAETLFLPLIQDPTPAAAAPGQGADDDRNETAPLPDVDALFDGLARDRRSDQRGDRRAARRAGGGAFDGLLPDPEVAPARAAAPEDVAAADADLAETLPLSGPPGGRAGATFDPGELRPGTRLGHFQIEAPLGRGGMGAVYRALDLSLERFVAVKVIRPDRAGSSRALRAATPRTGPPRAGSPQTGSSRAGSPQTGETDVRTESGVPSTGSGSQALDRLLQEARAQARVNHPNVAHVYFVSPDPDKPFLAMELVEGSTLADVLKKQGALPYGAVTRLGAEIAGALECAAKYDIVHGDVKPSNVLLAHSRHDGPDRVGTVKLSDFGLARRTSRQRVGGLEGTPNYLAPEVVRGGSPTVQSDLYALGVTLFEMTFGRLPYTTRKQGLSHRLGAHLTNAPEFPDPWPANLPPGWQDVLARLLEKDPADRPATAAEAAGEILRLAPQSNTLAGPLIRSLGALTDLGLVVLISVGMFATLARPTLNAIDQVIGLPGWLTSVIPLVLLSKLLACVPSLLFAWWQARTGRTPGKTLFQMRIVDRYGLPPSKRTLLVRGLAQTFPIWGLAVSVLVEELTGQLWLEQSLALFVLTVWALDNVAGLFSAKSRTLHDRLLGTRVALDTAARSE
ncbi:protein kinase domain-containing protein [Alienimonas californiensis]|uniref:Serine/threonine-protein kinase PrkC n=1 Tax=Alienimonas californiensis TaxID=2527989 RepID=A0A517P6G6_9PLAN|nr:protein kinase [Alienimonas californiensis]QDT14960.1 Serine/threonine-protein kinase PrkC [Alienimonas californiensis]